MHDGKRWNLFSLDRRGSLSIQNGEVRRRLVPELFETFREFEADGRLDRLHDAGLIHTEAVAGDEPVVAHQFVPFVTYPQEWSLEMLRAAAIVVLDISMELIQGGYRLHDAHPWNVAFYHGKPQFLDFSSIERGSRPTPAWAQEFFSTFYLPLWLKSKYQHGLSDRVAREDAPIGGRLGARATGRFLFHPKGLGRLAGRYWILAARLTRSSDPGSVLRGLRRHLVSIRLPSRKSEWGSYSAPGGDYDDLSSYTEKARAVRSFLEDLPPGRLVDMACNRGWFCGLATTFGHEAFGFDLDENAINEGFAEGAARLGFDVALMDVLWPTQRQGFFAQLPSAIERWQCDTLLMVSLIHHLVLRQHVSFDGIAAIANAFGPRNVIIEWIPPDDYHLRGWPAKGNPIPDWYREEDFIAAMSVFFPRHEEEVSWSGPADGGEQAPRKMFLFQR